jgi:hypothetical protein
MQEHSTTSHERGPAEIELADLLERAARALSDSAFGAETRNEVVAQAVEGIPGAEMASISATSLQGLMTTIAATDPVAAQADKLQAELKEGPCFEAGTTGETRICHGLADDDRWPRYGPAGAELGIVSQLAVNVYVIGTTGMALNLYSRQPAVFKDSHQAAELFSSEAAIAIGFADTVEAHKRASLARGIIGQAIGITMERYGIDETKALAVLVRTSQDGNIKLRDVAAALVEATNNGSRV